MCERERNVGPPFGPRAAEVLPRSLHSEPQTARLSGRDDCEATSGKCPIGNTVLPRQKSAR